MDEAAAAATATASEDQEQRAGERGRSNSIGSISGRARRQRVSSKTRGEAEQVLPTSIRSSVSKRDEETPPPPLLPLAVFYMEHLLLALVTSLPLLFGSLCFHRGILPPPERGTRGRNSGT